MQERFGRWTFIKLGEPAKHPKAAVRCDCGAVRDVSISDLKSGKSQSCGCLHREALAARNRTHGKSHTPEYISWRGMLDRCRNPKHAAYKNYGGRGIRVCRRWSQFENFFSDMGQRPDDTSLERRNNIRNYTPSNCYWATRAQQARNTRKNRYLTYQGLTLCLSDWAQRLEIHPSTLGTRITRNWPPEDVFNPRKRQFKPHKRCKRSLFHDRRVRRR